MIKEMSEILLGIFIGFLAGILPSFHINNVSSLAYLLYLKHHISIFYFLLSSLPSFCFGSLLCSFLFFSLSSENEIYLPLFSRYFRQYSLSFFLYLISLSCFFSILYCIFLTLLPLSLFSSIYSFVISHLFIFVLLLSLILLIHNFSFLNLLLAILSSLLGYLVLVVLNLNQNFTLLPLFAGLYGLPVLVKSMKNTIKTKNMKEKGGEIKKKKLKKNIKISEVFLFSFLGFLSSALCMFFPAIPPSFILSLFPFNRKVVKNYIISVSSLSFSDSLLSIFAIISIGNSRNGVGVVLQNIQQITYTHLFILFLISSSLIFIFYFISRYKGIERIKNIMENLHMKLLVLLIILLLTYLTTSFVGVFVLFSSFLVGYFCLEMKLTPQMMLFSLLFPLLISSF